MGQLVPESSRGRFFARRTRLSTIASFSGLIIAGALLQWFDQLDLARYGFACVFAIGLTARLISAYYLSQVQDPQKQLPNPAAATSAAAFPSIKQIAADAAYLRFTAFFAMMQFSVAISGPFVVVYLLTTLQYSYLALTLNTAASVLRSVHCAEPMGPVIGPVRQSHYSQSHRVFHPICAAALDAQ